MASTMKIINAALNGLSPRQREVIEGRFGLKGGKAETLAAIGDRMGITRERVRQIEVRAFEKVQIAVKGTIAKAEAAAMEAAH